MCDFSEIDAGRRWAGEAGPSSQALQEAEGKPEHPQESMPASGAKATNFASYNPAVPVAAAAGHLSSPIPMLITGWKAIVEIVGYNQGNRRRGGLSFPLLSSFSESVTKWVRRLKIIWLNFLETDTHSCLPATCFLPPSPSPLSSFSAAHLIFWEEISSFLCGAKETVRHGLTWPWHCFCQASCKPGNIKCWILDSCFSFCTFIFLKLPPCPLLFNNHI